MDRPDTPQQPPDYVLPSYSDLDYDEISGGGTSIRLLTSPTTEDRELFLARESSSNPNSGRFYGGSGSGFTTGTRTYVSKDFSSLSSARPTPAFSNRTPVRGVVKPSVSVVKDDSSCGNNFLDSVLSGGRGGGEGNRASTASSLPPLPLANFMAKRKDTTPEHLEGLRRQEEGDLHGAQDIQRDGKDGKARVQFAPLRSKPSRSTPTTNDRNDCGSPRRKPVAETGASASLARKTTVRLQRRQKPEVVVRAEIAQALPTIPEGPSPRVRERMRSIHHAAAQDGVDERDMTMIDRDDQLTQHGTSVRPTRRSFAPSIISRHSSILDPLPLALSAEPSMASGYTPSASRRTDPAHASPTRLWSPSVTSEYGRGPPPPAGMYEPADLNGSPRPGTPSSRYGGSPRRPLPPMPLFFNGAARDSRTTFGDDATVNISLVADGADDDDVFGPRDGMPVEADLSDSRHMHARKSYANMSQGSSLSEADDDTAVTGADDAADDNDDINNDDDDDDNDDDDNTRSSSSHDLHRRLPSEKLALYGPAPEGKQERRGVRAPQMSRKEVQLINGELVLECKIPTILYSFLPRRDEVEFTHMRYTAVTCDPDDFVDRGYKLRQNIGRTARETELFICVTMYNEDEYGFTRTMHAVAKNIAHFCARSRSRTWGELGWQKIVVCVVSDGRDKIHPRTLDALAAMGVYQHGIAKNYVNQKAVQAHVYEYTTQVSLDADLKFKGAEKGIVPCQMMFCLKEKNLKKLNSHRWFFNAFGKALNPNVCILLDVGTRPGNKSLYRLWKAFDTDSNVAGACGEIKAMKGRWGLHLLNPIVASQNFEYKMSNILDKPLESVFGYITVLPGALSAYRFHALQNDETGHGPLSQYFKGETLHGQHADVFTANMYLAEDRILCWELVAKRGERWVLKYVSNCTGETDVPDTVPEFISQRRRWLNGAFFAAVYSLVHFRQVWATDHSVARKILLHVEFVYQLVQLSFTYFSLANFYLTFYFVAGGLSDPATDPFGHGAGLYIFTVLRYSCVLLICTQFIISMGNRPQGAKRMYLVSMVVYGIIMAYTVFACFYIVIRALTDHTKLHMGNNVFTNVVVSVSSTAGLYFIMSFLYLEPWHMFTSSAQYFMLLPSYVCALQVYAFCNTHDVTWGTKGDNVIKTDLGGAVGKGGKVELEMPSEQLDIDSGYDEALRNLRDRVQIPDLGLSEEQMHEDYYKGVRTYMVVLWMVANAVLAMAVSEAYGLTGLGRNLYLSFIMWSVAALALFRALGSTTFAVLNVVGMVVEGRVRLSVKGLGTRMPAWFGRMGDAVSSVGSKVTGAR